MQNNKDWFAIFCLILTMLMWSSAFVGIKIGLNSYTPAALALLRYIVASVFLLFLMAMKKKRTNIPKPLWFKIALLGFFGIAFYNIALNSGEHYVTAATSSFIISQSPLITCILSFLFLKERWNRRFLLGLMVSIAGVFLIAISHRGEINFTYGAMWVFFAALSGSIYSLLQRRLFQQYSSLGALEVVTWTILAGTIMMSWAFPAMISEAKVASLKSTIAVIFIGIFPAAIAYVTWAYGLKHFSASKAVSFLYMVPLLVTLLEWLLLGNLPIHLAFIGGLIALAGAAIININFKALFARIRSNHSS